MLVLIVATLFTFTWNAMSCAQVKGIQEIIKLIIGQKNIFLLKCCVAFWGYVHYLKSYLPSHLTLYHVSPTPGFMSPLEMVIFNSFPKASFSSASLSSLFQSSHYFQFIHQLGPCSTTTYSCSGLCYYLQSFCNSFLVTSSVVFLALVLLTRSSG